MKLMLMHHQMKLVFLDDLAVLLMCVCEGGGWGLGKAPDLHSALPL